MGQDDGYRFRVRLSLQVMQEKRRKICEDTLQETSSLAMGLYGQDADLRSMYLQMYVLEWLKSHWDSMQEILDRHRERPLDERRQDAAFFAGCYGRMIDGWRLSGELSGVLLPELLEAQKKVTQEIINRGNIWEQKCQELKVMIMKQKAEFAQLIKQCEEE